MTTLNPPQTEINSVIALYSNGQIQEVQGSWKKYESHIQTLINDLKPYLKL
jgi:hypothetical protein